MQIRHNPLSGGFVIGSEFSGGMKNILKYGKHEVMGMVRVPFYERKGDGKGTDGYLLSRIALQYHRRK